LAEGAEAEVPRNKISNKLNPYVTESTTEFTGNSEKNSEHSIDSPSTARAGVANHYLLGCFAILPYSVPHAYISYAMKPRIKYLNCNL
jgi:hypothetical protein